jgi:hypothetical protein
VRDSLGVSETISFGHVTILNAFETQGRFLRLGEHVKGAPVVDNRLLLGDHVRISGVRCDPVRRHEAWREKEKANVKQENM